MHFRLSLVKSKKETRIEQERNATLDRIADRLSDVVGEVQRLNANVAALVYASRSDKYLKEIAEAVRTTNTVIASK